MSKQLPSVEFSIYLDLSKCPKRLTESARGYRAGSFVFNGHTFNKLHKEVYVRYEHPLKTVGMAILPPFVKSEGLVVSNVVAVWENSEPVLSSIETYYGKQKNSKVEVTVKETTGIFDCSYTRPAAGVSVHVEGRSFTDVARAFAKVRDGKRI